ncbi:type VII secretion target [Nocardia callitridis]|uniref:Uncharacterized protein n=1 Tax=Nocardia callitridis TaxID=648753 RepID=A0ABP9JT56_9NOCA
MPGYLEIDPDNLRRTAEQHRRTGAKLRKWGAIPHDWLADFQSSYGTIADQVFGALTDYYQRRYDSAHRQADRHDRTADELDSTARAIEESDHRGSRDVSRAGAFDNTTSVPNPTHDLPGTPNGTAAPEQSSPVVPTPPSPPPTSEATPAHDLPTNSHSPGHDGDDLGEVTRSPAATPLPAVTTSPFGDPAGTAPPPNSLAPPGHNDPLPAAPPSTVIGSAPAHLESRPPPDAAAPPVPPGGYGPTASSAGPQPLPPGPLASVRAQAGRADASTTLTVTEQDDQDLPLARALLAATLAAVHHSAPDTEWAVAVLRSTAGPVIFMTSTEGRGWVPPGLFLPSEVIIPWTWDTVFGAATQLAIAAVEGIDDPARIVAEFGIRAKRIRGIRISALASSTDIPEGLRADLGDDVAMEGRVEAAEGILELTTAAAGLVDRLALAGSAESIRVVAAVPDSGIRDQCLELARTAHARVGTAPQHQLRQRILDAMHDGVPVPPGWWAQLRADSADTAAALRSHRGRVSHVPVGARLSIPNAEVLRGMAFQQRADELVLLLAETPNRQTLRDALYAYGQILEHPLLPEQRPTVQVGSGALADNATSPGSVSVRAAAVDERPPSIAAFLPVSSRSESVEV